MLKNETFNQKLRKNLYETNEIFVQNHIKCRENLFETFHKMRGDESIPDVTVWLNALKEVEKYFTFNEDEKKMFYTVSENYYGEIEADLEDYPLDTSPQFHVQCEIFVCLFELYINREQDIH